ncbi:regulatory factor X-associated protein [Platysternon megacephalum]|uniref:Regulatory factor X-associated protein n=1 Tax=Platysternon megacephalum TaxID=55544 RepID=A0A4D9EA04_9SAUR|nr:regulatory factor X-associated protein [Platysternon megacephalum]
MSLPALSSVVRVVGLPCALRREPWRLRGRAPERRSLGTRALCPVWGGAGRAEGGFQHTLSPQALSSWLLEGGGTGQLVASRSEQEAASLASGNSSRPSGKGQEGVN